VSYAVDPFAYIQIVYWNLYAVFNDYRHSGEVEVDPEHRSLRHHFGIQVSCASMEYYHFTVICDIYTVFGIPG